ncbi:MAG: hypothetical protein AAGD06_32055 [Acidobacteriota bacterium]
MARIAVELECARKGSAKESECVKRRRRACDCDSSIGERFYIGGESLCFPCWVQALGFRFDADGQLVELDAADAADGEGQP